MGVVGEGVMKMDVVEIIFGVIVLIVVFGFFYYVIM